MKKYLLWWLLTLIWIFNFTSANNFQMTCTDENWCTPDALTLNAWDTLIWYSDTEEWCAITATAWYEFHFENYNCANLWINEEWFYCDSRDNKIEWSLTLLDAETLYFWHYQCNGPNTLTISYSSANNSWWDWWNIIEWWVSAFSGIIDRLWWIFWEFWPYIIYIAIACLGISLLFKALKYILWFTDNSAKNSIWWRAWMKERRKRRRKMRRYKRTEQEAKKYYFDNNYDRDEAWNWKLYRRSRKNSNYLKKYRYKK